MKIDDSGIEFIKKWEGFRERSYQDSAGIWTIGYGTTSQSGIFKVGPNMIITEDKADKALRTILDTVCQQVSSCVKVPVSQSQFNALVSFVYNVGFGNFKKSTLLKKLNVGNYEDVPTELMKWTYSGKTKLQGLVNRRSAEAGVWASGSYVSSRDALAHPKKHNMLGSPEIVGPVIGAAAGSGTIFSGTGPLQWALAFVMVISCLVAVWYFVRRVKEGAF